VGLAPSHKAIAGVAGAPAQAAHVSRTSSGLLDQLGRLLPLPLPVPDWSKPIILLLLIVALGFGIRARVNSRRARRLSRRQQRLIADLDSMQAALVPAIPPRVGDLKVSAAYQPADGPASGGDFYDAFALDGGRVAIILGDVSGHGRAALAHAVRMRYTLRAYVEAGLGPRAALKLAGGVFAGAEDDLFATVAIAVYDKHAASLTYAAAGHPAPLTLGGPIHTPLLSCASPALGWSVPTGRRQTTIPFSRGMSACFFSDGLTEAHTDDGLLGRDRLAEILAPLDKSDAAPTLLSRVRTEAKEIRDDMAACIIEATTGDAVRDVTIEELEVSFAQLKAGQSERFLKACGVDPKDIASLGAQAAGIAREEGAAVFKAVRGARAVTATVSPPRAFEQSTSEDAHRRASSFQEPAPMAPASPKSLLAARA